MAIVGVVPQTLAPFAVVLGAGSSIGLLMLFFHPWLVLGLVIDVASLWAVIVAEWSPIAA
jgi:hypothetical protein